ncbi:MAG: hypothetical protein LBO20_00530 [Bifidobacteriaceae bacterium]|nr:hypothetical protein [Bifidobacteriaceae bacterium]
MLNRVSAPKTAKVKSQPTVRPGPLDQLTAAPRRLDIPPARLEPNAQGRAR